MSRATPGNNQNVEQTKVRPTFSEENNVKNKW